MLFNKFFIYEKGAILKYMKTQKIDQRIKYTKHLIYSAILDLLEEYSIGKINVSMLCKKANINRSTFYSHYETIEQVIEEIENDTLSNLQMYITSSSEVYKEANFEQAMIQALEYIKNNCRLFKILLSKNVNWNFTGIMIHLLNNELREITSEELRQNKDNYNYVIQFCVHGVTSIIKLWLDNNTKESPQKMAKLITNLLLRNVTSTK